MFVLKSLIGDLLMPLPLSLLFALTGYFLLLAGRLKAAKVLLGLSLSALLLLGMPIVTDTAVTQYENQIPPIDTENLPHFKAIVILGGSKNKQPEQSPISRVEANSFQRIGEGVRLWRLRPETIMIFAGDVKNEDVFTLADANAEAAIALGVPDEKIIRLPWAGDTRKEARMIKEYLGDRPFILVSSATHLPRALNEFHAVGLHPVPAPSNHIGRVGGYFKLWQGFIPAAQFLNKAEILMHELIGLVWQKLTLPAAPEPITQAVEHQH